MKANAVLLVGALAVAAASPLARAADPPAKPPDEFQKVMAELEKDFNAIDAKARQEKAERLGKTLKQLQDLQDAYTKAGKLDEAVAVRDSLRRLRQDALNLVLGDKVLDDPGSMNGLRGKNGEVFYFKVIGSNTGRVWGTGVYADDSNLATAAVHAGALKVGEVGVVKVTVLAGQAKYEGSTQNEVTSTDYGQWYGSFAVVGVKAEKK